MSKIIALSNYLGSKGGMGTAERIINLIIKFAHRSCTDFDPDNDEVPGNADLFDPATAF